MDINKSKKKKKGKFYFSRKNAKFRTISPLFLKAGDKKEIHLFYRKHTHESKLENYTKLFK